MTQQYFPDFKKEFMSRAEDHYIHQLLEPDDIIITGRKYKRDRPAFMEKVADETELEKRQRLARDKETERDFLKKHGITF